MSVSLGQHVRVRGKNHEASRLEDLVGDDRFADADLLEEDRAAAVRRALISLPEAERTVLTMYYFDELLQPQIAQVLGVSESRVSQVRSAALSRLKRRLRRAV